MAGVFQGIIYKFKLAIMEQLCIVVHWNEQETNCINITVWTNSFSFVLVFGN